MKNHISLLSLTSLLFIIPFSFGQQYRTGLDLSGGSSAGLNIYERSSFGFGETLPDSISWRQFAPYPGNQGNYGTCVGWSSGYCGLTTLYAKQLNIKNRNVITAMAMCPYTVYNNIKSEYDYGCQQGTTLEDAGSFLTSTGTKRFYIHESDCGTTEEQDMKMGIYKADDFSALWEWGFDMDIEATSEKEKIEKTKSALADGNIVVIGMGVSTSFMRDVNSKGVWEKSTNIWENYPRGGHAMCVLGYNDKRFGGTFEVQNSWGQDWGAGGYVYITYEDFGEYVGRAIALELEEQELETSNNIGCVYGDCNESYSKFKFDNGDIYEGMAKNGKANGQGVYQWMDGDVFAGNFVEGLKDGEGIYFYADGTSQRGHWRNDEFRKDLAYLDYKYSMVKLESYRLSGYMKNKEWLYGSCISNYSYNQIYQGILSSQGGPHGFGLLNYSEEYILGLFQEGENHGFATIYDDEYENWNVYNCIHDECDKVGSELISKKYENIPLLKEFVQDSVATEMDSCLFGNCENSFSRLVYSSNSKFEGFLVNGWRHGYGTYTFPEESEIVSYEGEYSFGERSGVGRLKMKDGSWFIGEFESGMINGRGMWVKADGTIQAGFWEDNTYVEPDEEFGFASDSVSNFDTRNKGLSTNLVERAPRLFLSPIVFK